MNPRIITHNRRRINRGWALTKKKLAVVTIEKEAKDEFVRQVRALFADYLIIEGYSIREKIEETIEADLILISASIATSIVKPYLPEGVEIIYIDIAFHREGIEKLREVPPGTSAMLVDYSYTTAVDIISILYEIGIKHLDLKPVYLDILEEEIPEVELAVTPGLLPYVPAQVSRIIDIGWRMIGVSTLLDIAVKLGFLDTRLEEKLLNYAQDLRPESYGLTTALQSSSHIKNQMEVVLEIIDDGIAVVDDSNTIIHCNRILCDILGVKGESLQNRTVDNLAVDLVIRQEIFSMEVEENRLVETGKNGRKLVVTRRRIKMGEKEMGYVIIVKDVTQIERLESQLRKKLLRRGHIAKYTFADIIGKSPVMVDCLEKARKIASIDATVLISGDTGTGKELFAQSIHNHSSRRSGPFVAINCAALPSNLLESELFGYEDGAFSGAKKGGKHGLFELAHKGTLFIDEAGDIPLSIQVKLLRVLEEKEMMRIGGINIIPVDVRILAATNRDLPSLIREGKLRKDLYYRLNGLSLFLPHLARRKSDIPCLVQNILANIGCSQKVVDDELMQLLQSFQWEGNVRELKNCVEYMGHMGGSVLTIKDLPDNFHALPVDSCDETKFKELSYHESHVGETILDILRQRNAGRRLLHELLM